MFPCFVIFAPPAAATNADAVEQLKVCIPVPPVPQVSIFSLQLTSILSDFCFMTTAAPVISFSDIPLLFKPVKKDSISASETVPDII